MIEHCAITDKVWDRFCSDITSEEDRTEVCERIAEAFWHTNQQNRESYEGVTLHDIECIDVINARAEGSIEYKGKQYGFIVENGNRVGFLIEDWEGDKEFVHRPVTVWALAPNTNLISDAIRDGQGPFLIAKWDAMLTRPYIGDIPGKYTYDRRVQPGSKTETYWKEKAAKHYFDIVTEDEAQRIRARLEQATKKETAA